MSDQENDARIAKLDQYSTEELEELLRGEIASPDQGDDALVFHILEVMQARETSSDDQRKTQAAWEQFQRYYNIPEGEKQSLYPVTEAQDIPLSPKDNVAMPPSAPVRRRGYRYVAFAAAVIAALMVCMVTAQAVGLDIFGAIARWTEETFQFAPDSDRNPLGEHRPTPLPQNLEYVNAIQKELANLALPLELAPTWFPDGYEMKDCDTVSEPSFLNSLHCSFYGHDTAFFFVQMDECFIEDALNSLVIEKDSTPVEEYFTHGKQFYILSNIDTMTATWSDGRFIITIAGSLSPQELKKIIDSLEEIPS